MKRIKTDHPRITPIAYKPLSENPLIGLKVSHPANQKNDTPTQEDEQTAREALVDTLDDEMIDETKH